MFKEQFQQKDRLANYLGMELVAAEGGRAEARMAVNSHHLNGADVVHGGAIFSLADFAFAAASNSEGTLSLAINCSINFTKAGKEGDTLIAKASKQSESGKLGSYRVDVTNGSGETVALFQGSVYKKGQR